MINDRRSVIVEIVTKTWRRRVTTLSRNSRDKCNVVFVTQRSNSYNVNSIGHCRITSHYNSQSHWWNFGESCQCTVSRKGTEI